MTDICEIDTACLSAMPIALPEGEIDKDGRGRVLVVAGSRAVPGAAILTGVAALRAGAGKLQLAVPAVTALGIGLRVPEAKVFALPETPEGEIAPEATEDFLEAASRTDAIAIGPGMLDGLGASDLTHRLLQRCDRPVFVIDAAAMAGAIGYLQECGIASERVVVTPHAGEMASLLGIEKSEVQAEPLKIARAAAERLGAVVVLKGHDTYIVRPSGEAWCHRAGSVGLATSGSGDVLAGIVTGLAARGLPPAHAAVWGVFAHGRAGARLTEAVSPLGFLARELLGEISGALAAGG